MKQILVLFILVGSSLSTYEQPNSAETSRITGEIYDGTTNEPLASVNVSIVGTTLGASTEIDGRFNIQRVPVGTYSVRVTAIGYTPFIATDIVIMVAKPTDIRIPLIESLVQVEGVQITASYFQNLPDAANMASGIYFYRLQARQIYGGQAGLLTETKKLVLLR